MTDLRAPSANWPASHQIRDQLQATLSGTYTIERELGGGGMSRVFVAEEIRLRRKVAVKVLSPELAQGLSIERFEREIQTAAALQQANIVPVLSAGDTNGLPFYVMPFVEGESLRARLAQGALAIGAALSILRDVARALEYAHTRGVVHRDIKPDNVLLSGSTAVVTDFGIAKAISASRDTTTSGALTQLGTSIGTPAYMAPEQAAGDPDTDHRADIYAFGCLAYELLTGRSPFAHLAPHKMLAAHMNQVPAPLQTLRADVPPGIAQLVNDCLAKDPARRPTNAASLLRVLDEPMTSGDALPSLPKFAMARPGALWQSLVMLAVAGVAVWILAKAAIVGIGLPDWVMPASLALVALGVPAILFTAYVQRAALRALSMTPVRTPGGTAVTNSRAATMALRVGSQVSWARTWKAGLATFAMFALLVGGYMALRTLGLGPSASLLAAGRYNADEPLIVSDFAVNAGADSLLGATMAEAVKQDLLQSDLVKLASAADVSRGLTLMQRPPNTRLSIDVAREVALRIRGRVVVGGSLQTVGTGYLVTLQLTSADSGTTLATYSAGADSPKELIATVGALTRKLRAKLGESLRRVQSGPPLEEVSTSSLDALRAYTEATQLSFDGKRNEGVRAFQRAIALDSNFASAYRRLAAELSTLGGQRAEMLRHQQRAFALREHLPFLDRYMVEGTWWRAGPTPNIPNAIRAYEALLAERPNHVPALNNLANSYLSVGDFARAEQVARRGAALADAIPISASTVVNILLQQGKTTEARRFADSARARFPKGLELDAWVAMTLVAAEHDDSAAVVVSSVLSAPSASAVAVDRAAQAGMTIAFRRGRVLEGVRLAEVMADARGKRGSRAAAVVLAINRTLVDALVRDDRARAAARIDSLVKASAMDSLEPADRPYLEFAKAAAFAGRPVIARRALASAEAQQPWGPENPIRYNAVRASRGVVAMSEGRYDDALTELRLARAVPLSMRDVSEWTALAHDLVGNRDSAIVHFKQSLSDKTADLDQGRYFGAVPYRLGELYEAKGDFKAAASSYARFIEQWKLADAELQPRVQEARKRLVRIQQRAPG